FFGKVEAKVEMNHYNTPRTLMPLSPPISANVHTSDTLWGAHLRSFLNNLLFSASPFKVSLNQYLS
ncbi:MAG: hypothetical protein KBD88_05655, partial [Aliarcobacter sp.]|nr:hypothetical protein [Aliarcobacter sp.]